MLTLLLGTDWTANRKAVLNRIAEDVANQKAGRILMVPELISHDTERRLCEAAGDTCSRFAEVLTFSRLAKRVSDATGHGARECLDNGGRIVAMASAARQLHSRLKAYASVETRPEFLSGLVDAVDEFKRCCITSADLRQAAGQTQGSLAQKLEELSLILESYDTLCQRGKKDPRDQMSWLLEELQEGSFAQEHVFYIDGFPDFTRQHMAILMHLVCQSQQVIVSLNCDKVASSAMAFEKAGQTAAELIRGAKKLGIPVDIQYIQPREDALSPVRENLYQGHMDQDRRVIGLKTYQTETVYQECVAAVETILELVHSGSRYRDINVVCSDIPAYKNIITMLFERCNIPFYLSGTEEILEKSVITTVLAALDTALGGFEQQDVLHYLKSMLSPLGVTVCDQLENYVITWGINGKRWLDHWQHHPDGLGGNWDDVSRELLCTLNHARKLTMDPLQRLQKGFDESRNLGEQICVLYRFLEDVSLKERIESMADHLDRKGDNRSAQILNQLWEILLSALEQLHDVLGETTWEPDHFTRLFKLLLSQYDVGTIPPVLDAVTVGPVSAMRCQQGQHLIVLGARDGAFPGYGGSTGVLSDHERTVLRQMGVPLTGGAMEGLQAEFAEIYGVFCGAEKSITVSLSGAEPSFLYRRLCSLAGGEEKASYALGCAMANAWEAAAYLLRNGGKAAAEALKLDAVYDEVAGRTAYTLGNVGEGNIRKLYGQKLKLSASQIDKQADCRLMYFLRYGLRAKERKAATVDPAEFGTYVHSVLEATACDIMELGGFHNVSLEKTLEIARDHSEAYAKQRFSDIDTERLNYLFKRNSQELELIVQELWKELRDSQFEPVGFEVAFGDDGEMAAVDISGQHMPAQLRGFVDRVDVWENNGKQYFRVVDYKTGKKDFDYCDIYNGYGLQMLLYMFALEQEGVALLGDHPAPAGVQYFPARVPLVPADGVLSDEEAEQAREKVWKRRGLLLEQEDVLLAMESAMAPNRLSYTRKKDGSISGDIADFRHFAMLKTYVFSLVGKMVDDIASGCVAPNPYTRGTSHSACDFCPYSSVCHLENIEQRRNYKAVTAERFWEDVEREVSKLG